MYPNDGSHGEIKYRTVQPKRQSHKVTFQALIDLAWDDKDVTIERMVEHGFIQPLLPNHEYDITMDMNPDDQELNIPSGMVIYRNGTTQRFRDMIADMDTKPVERIPKRTTEATVEQRDHNMVSVAWCFMDQAFPDMSPERAMSAIIGSYLTYSNDVPADEHYVEPAWVQQQQDSSTLDAMNRVFG